MTRKVVEVAKRARELVEQLREEHFEERDIVLGLTIATQATPITKALQSNQSARRVLDRLIPLVQEGIGLAREIGEITKRGK